MCFASWVLKFVDVVIAGSERWNKKFKDLVTEMEASAKAYKVALDFDSPYMQLGFEGVAAKEQVNVRVAILGVIV